MMARWVGKEVKREDRDGMQKEIRGMRFIPCVCDCF